IVINNISLADKTGGVKQKQLVAFKGVPGNGDGSGAVAAIAELDADRIDGNVVVENIGVLWMVGGTNIAKHDAAILVVDQLIALDHRSLDVCLEKHAVGHTVDVVVAHGIVKGAFPARIGARPIRSGDDQHSVVGAADGVVLDQGVVRAKERNAR